jgi:hypothetical protein
MKKTVLTYGLIAGFISCIGFFLLGQDMDFDKGMIYGFGSMILAFSLIFVAVKSYRDKHNGGLISFGKAFEVGLYVALIASTIYVFAWLFSLNFMFPDFAEKYSSYLIAQMQAEGASAAEISAKMQEMNEFKESYKNPIIVILYTYMEILPLGIVVALITAAFLKKKNKLTPTT